MPKSEGYIWVIPRGDNTSIGGGTAEICHFHELKQEINAFVKKCYPQAEKISTWTALIPNVKNAKTFRNPVAGPNWMLIGDAAGHVSPISGSGISYALLDGEIAADAVVNGHPEQFNEMWVKAYGQGLFLETQLRGMIYRRPLLELYCMYMKFRSMMPFA